MLADLGGDRRRRLARLPPSRVAHSSASSASSVELGVADQRRLERAGPC